MPTTYCQPSPGPAVNRGEFLPSRWPYQLLVSISTFQCQVRREKRNEPRHWNEKRHWNDSNDRIVLRLPAGLDRSGARSFLYPQAAEKLRQEISSGSHVPRAG